MGIGDLIDGIEAMLTMSGLGKIQTSINAANYAVPLVGAANNNPGKPKGYMELPDFSKVLGAGVDSGRIVHLNPSEIQGGTYTINKGLHQAILSITSNKNGNASTPSLFVIPRNNSVAIQMIYEGNCIQLSNLSMNEDGGIIISGLVNVHLYYRFYDMELIL